MDYVYELQRKNKTQRNLYYRQKEWSKCTNGCVLKIFKHCVTVVLSNITLRSGNLSRGCV